MSTPHYKMHSGSGEEKEDLEVLQLVNKTLESLGEFVYVCECGCEDFRREGTNPSIRNKLDSLTVEEVQKQFPKSAYPTIVLLSLGAENLKQEATQAGNLMKVGYNVELILIGHQYKRLSEGYRKTYATVIPSVKHARSESKLGDLREARQIDEHKGHVFEEAALCENNYLPKMQKQFEKVTAELEKRYGKSCKIIGQFSSLEVYKAIIEGKPAPQSVPSYKSRSGEETTYQEDALNAAYQEEYQTYGKSCHGKIPQACILIDDISELGGPHGDLSLRQTLIKDDEYQRTMHSFCEFLYDQSVSGVCESSRAKGNAAQQQILFIDTTKKKKPSHDSSKNPGDVVEVRARAVDIQDPKKKQTLSETVWEVPKQAPAHVAKNKPR